MRPPPLGELRDRRASIWYDSLLRDRTDYVVLVAMSSHEFEGVAPSLVIGKDGHAGSIGGDGIGAVLWSAVAMYLDAVAVDAL